jgi:hypothetical protein
MEHLEVVGQKTIGLVRLEPLYRHMRVLVAFSEKLNARNDARPVMLIAPLLGARLVQTHKVTDPERAHYCAPPRISTR